MQRGDKNAASEKQGIGLSIALGIVLIAYIYVKFVAPRKDSTQSRPNNTAMDNNQEEEKKQEP